MILYKGIHLETDKYLFQFVDVINYSIICEVIAAV